VWAARCLRRNKGLPCSDGGMPHGEADYFVRRLQVLVTGEVDIRRPHESVETAKTFNAILLQKYPEHARARMAIHDRATDAANLAAHLGL